MMCQELSDPGAEPGLEGHGTGAKDDAFHMAGRPQQLVLAVQEGAHDILHSDTPESD